MRFTFRRRAFTVETELFLRSAARRSREAISQLPERVNDSNEIDLDEFGSAAESEDDDGVMHGDNVLENIDPHDMFEPRLPRRLGRKSLRLGPENGYTTVWGRKRDCLGPETRLFTVTFATV